MSGLAGIITEIEIEIEVERGCRRDLVNGSTSTGLQLKCHWSDLLVVGGSLGWVLCAEGGGRWCLSRG